LPASNEHSPFGDEMAGDIVLSRSWKLFFEAVLAMKHFQNFYVCIGEGDDKLHVAEKHNDYNDHKETAPR
jgi:hypothetical protein